MSLEWRHRQYERPAGRGPADFCVVCEDEGWPCDAERERLRADRLGQGLLRVLAAAEFRRPRFDESGDAWLKARDHEWMESVKAARAAIEPPEPAEAGGRE